MDTIAFAVNYKILHKSDIIHGNCTKPTQSIIHIVFIISENYRIWTPFFYTYFSDENVRVLNISDDNISCVFINTWKTQQCRWITKTLYLPRQYTYRDNIPTETIYLPRQYTCGDIILTEIICEALRIERGLAKRHFLEHYVFGTDRRVLTCSIQWCRLAPHSSKFQSYKAESLIFQGTHFPLWRMVVTG